MTPEEKAKRKAEMNTDYAAYKHKIITIVDVANRLHSINNLRPIATDEAYIDAVGQTDQAYKDAMSDIAVVLQRLTGELILKKPAATTQEAAAPTVIDIDS